MALTTYSELKSAILAWLHRPESSLPAAQVQEFIALAESDLKVRAKLTQWDAEATVTITSGSGPLPSGCDHVNSVIYGSQTSELDYLPPERFKSRNVLGDAGADPIYYTIIGDTLRITPSTTGSAAVLYTARFTSLSDTDTTNSLLTLFPDAYLHGSLVHGNLFVKDTGSAQTNAGLFEADIDRIKRYMRDRKYPQGLQMRVA